MKDVLAKCFKKTAAQVCGKTCNCLHEKNLPGLKVLFCVLLWLFCHALLSRIIELCAVLIIIVLAAIYTCNTLLSRILSWTQHWSLLFSLPWLSYDALIALYYLIKCNTDYCLFSQVKNKPWIPWVYPWIWHRRWQLY